MRMRNVDETQVKWNAFCALYDWCANLVRYCARIHQNQFPHRHTHERMGEVYSKVIFPLHQFHTNTRARACDNMRKNIANHFLLHHGNNSLTKFYVFFFFTRVFILSFYRRFAAISDENEFVFTTQIHAKVGKILLCRYTIIRFISLPFLFKNEENKSISIGKC